MKYSFLAKSLAGFGLAVLVLAGMVMVWVKVKQGQNLAPIEITVPEVNLAEEIRECSPLSDWGSHEKCNRLIKQITSFDMCQGLGFPIQETLPPTCVLPDGTKLVDSSDPADGRQVSWEEAIRLIKDCEVAGLFQTHDQSVYMNLKSGERVITFEPAIDDVFDVYNQAKDSCGDIPVATE